MTDLRIAIAYDCLFPASTGGGERVYRRMADLFVERGAQVDYVTRRQWDAAPPAAPFRIVPVWSGSIYDPNGNRTTSSAVAFALALFRHFRAHRRDYDLVVVSALPVLNLFAVRAALLGRRTVIVADWLEVWPWRKWRSYTGAVVGTIAFVLQWLGLRVGRLQTVNSAFTAARVRRYRRGAHPVVLGLVDLAGDPAASLPAAEPPFALFVGRHISDKRLETLPAALAVARRTHSQLRLIVVGSGPETDALRQAARSAAVEEVVEFRGRVDDAQLDGLLSAAAVLVNPSAREGFGLVVAEAAAHGVPSVVVAGEDNAATELIDEGVNGFVAASVAPVEFGEAIARAVSAGAGLRRSSGEWYERERVDRGLGASVDEVLRKLRQ